MVPPPELARPSRSMGARPPMPPFVRLAEVAGVRVVPLPVLRGVDRVDFFITKNKGDLIPLNIRRLKTS
eukprot:11207455-Lingulodinium_polyedra.AAC.1